MPNPPPLITIGQRLVWLREKHGMRQADLAKEIGITAQSLGAIELGKTRAPSAPTLLRLAAVLDANPEWIIHGRGSPTIEKATQDTVDEFVSVFKQLSPEHQAALLAAAKSLK